MNKTININLGGFPFTLDDIAYDLLDRYISSIKNHFAYSDSYQEIITDIEIRLGELLHEKTNAKSIVTSADVEFAIKTMGRPEEFGAESIDLPGEDFEQPTAKKSTSGKNATRKLFRNMADKKLGGVSSGLAAYFGIQNPNWIRFAFIVFTVTGGFAVPLYIIMWIFIPEAKTSADYLAMKGEKITVSNIADYVEKEINNLSHHINEFTDDLSGRLGGSGKKSFRASGPSIDLEQNIKNGAARIVSFFRPLVMIVGGFLLLIFAGIWISMIVGYVFAIPFLGFINSTSPLINFVTTINSVIIMGVPLAFVIFWALRLVFKTQIHKSLRQSLLIFWLSNLVCLIVLGATTFREYRNYGESEIKQDLGGLKNDVIIIKSNGIDNSHGNIQFGNLRLADDDKLLIEHEFNLNILPSEDQQWSVIKRIKARGANGKEAKFNANCVDYNVVPLNNNELEIPNYFTINKDCKYRFQQVEVDLMIPVGKSIVIPESLEWRINNVSYDKDQMKDGWRYISGKTYTMTAKGLQCANCTAEELKPNPESVEYDYIPDHEIPEDALMQAAELKSNIAYQPNSELFVTFDKITGGGNGKMKFDKISMNVENSVDSMIHIIRKVKYYGKQPVSNEEIDRFYGYRQSGKEFIFANVGVMENYLEAVNPSIEVTLQLPQGAKIRFDDTMNQYEGEIKFDKDEIPGGWRFVKNELLQMGQKGLKCINCN